MELYVFCGIILILAIIDIILIVLLAYSHKLHYDEIKGLYSKIGIEIKTDNEDIKTSKVKNHIKKRIMEIENKQGGE